MQKTAPRTAAQGDGAQLGPLWSNVRPLHLLRLAGYYVVASGILAAFWSAVPEPHAARVSAPAGGLLGSLLRGEAPPPGGLGPALVVTATMLTALALMLPVAWAYAITKRAPGCDRSVMETLVILPVAVAAIAMMVRDSLPLAFSLAGIVAAVRFRNSLKDPKDAVYVFLAIGIGLAAGVRAMAAAVAMSAVCSVLVLVLWRFNLKGLCVDEGLCVDGRGRVWPRPLASTPAPHGGDGRPRALLLVRGAPLRPAWRAAEEVLTKYAKRWRLVERPGADPDALEYRLRLKRTARPDSVLEELRRRAGAAVLGAEIRLLDEEARR